MKKTREDFNNMEEVAYRMENEGLDYCFRHYSNFEEVKDEEFHRLKKEYINAAEKIESYVNSKIAQK